MNQYTAPLRDMRFVLKELVGLEKVSGLPGCEEVNAELVDQILDESARFCAEVIAPLNRTGDAEGSRWEDGKVFTPKGFKDAYRQFAEGGWNALQSPPEHGGQGLPKLVATLVMEMWKSSNMAFSLCPMLTTGAIEALILRGTDAQKKTYLPKMVDGTWTGTMNLTESQAGSDLALVRTRADREGDHYRIRGQKIFITYGEHDLTENIIHLVLARLPDAPPGVRGISLFIVPKFLVNADGSLGARNEVHCASIEHKLGIHASPTAVLVYGEKDGAIGYLVGEENRGLEYMFIMMNAARFAVGLEGLAIADRAYQQALGYARERIQSRDLGGGPQSVPIVRHPDVRRMLMGMKANIEAMRALGCTVAASMDIAHRHPDKAERQKHQAFADLMIPVVKGWFTETGVEVASTGVQIHGGMGYIEETGAAQHLRDARITTIYEGTTAIQSNDLVGRKLGREGGVTAKALVHEMRQTEAALAKAQGEDMVAIKAAFSAGLTAFADCVDWIAANFDKDVKAVHAGSVPFLKLTGIVAGGWQMARAALIAQQQLARGTDERAFYEGKIVTARYFSEHVLSQAGGLRTAIMLGSRAVLALAEEQL
ncbi:MAG: acyl-CoA dehydrogenase [Betaproteobacteria bacterium]|nr:acyl-CoA dehydrogenase [Betaproteobacteria bacterium]